MRPQFQSVRGEGVLPTLQAPRYGEATLTTGKGKWSAPAGYGLLVAPDVLHELAGFGIVEIGAAFFADDDVGPSGAAECEILRVSPLLKATLGALAQEPALYDLSGAPAIRRLLPNTRSSVPP